MEHILRVEGVNILANTMETSDISTVRGASFAYEAAVREIPSIAQKALGSAGKVDAVFVGASQCALHLRDVSQAEAEKLRDSILTALEAPLPFSTMGPNYKGHDVPTEFLTFAAGLAELGEGGIEAALQRAQTQVRMAQLHRARLSWPEPLDLGSIKRRDAVCPVDQTRPINSGDAGRMPTRVGQFPTAGVKSPDADGKTEWVNFSARTRDLRRFGQTARYEYYEKVMVDQKVENAPSLKGLNPAQSFEDIVNKPPADLPVSLNNKLAYLYFDGTGWGTVLRGLGTQKFSQRASKLFFHSVIPELLRHFVVGEDADTARFNAVYPDTDSERKKEKHLRLETLMLGGEDFLVVLPAWKAFEVTRLILDTVDEFNKDLKKAEQMPLRCGVLICNSKTPIRLCRNLAYEICDKARSKDGSSAQFHIIESVELPDDRLDNVRDRLFGTSDNDAFTFSNAELKLLCENIKQLKAGLPRSQVYKAIRRIDHHGQSPDSAFSQLDALNSLDLRALLPKQDVGGSFPFKLLAEYWDYVEPPREAPAEDGDPA